MSAFADSANREFVESRVHHRFAMSAFPDSARGA
jgi:hypothetical protein